jgi:hypothetical protein
VGGARQIAGFIAMHEMALKGRCLAPSNPVIPISVGAALSQEAPIGSGVKVQTRPLGAFGSGSLDGA